MRKYKDIVMFVLVCFSLIWFTACNKEEEHNTGFVFDNTSKELSIELDDLTCSLKLGDKLGSNVILMLENFYGNQSAYKNDTNSKLGTQELLNKFMSENYKYVSGEVDATEDEWADEILKAVKHNMPIRRSYAKEVSEAGFDSVSEALRIQEYYIKAIRKQRIGNND